MKLQKPVFTPRPPNKDELNAAWKRGWEAGKNKYVVVYECKRCGGAIELVDPKLKLAVALEILSGDIRSIWYGPPSSNMLSTLISLPNDIHGRS